MRRVATLVFSCATLMFLMSSTPRAQTAQNIQPLVISPPNFRELLDNPDQWKEVRSRTGEILAQDHGLASFKDSELQRWFAQMRSWGVGLQLEVGAIKEWGPTAAETFTREKPYWDRAIRLGADIRTISMDEPLIAARSKLHKSDDYASVQTAQFIRLARDACPRCGIGDIEPYPAISKNDHLTWIRSLKDNLTSTHTRSIDFYRLDVDWVSFAKSDRGSWRELANLVAAIKGENVPVSIIFWASGYPSESSAGIAGEDTWYVEVMAQGYAMADAGITPDQFVVETWIEAPSKTVPEDQEFTFTRSVRDLSVKFDLKRKPGSVRQ